MKIIGIENNSLGQKLGILIGDDLIDINGSPVRDIIDYRFLISDELVNIAIRRDGEIRKLQVEKGSDERLGLQFVEMKLRHCSNNCIFCFVDQNPPGLRKSLYLKDEDYRLSFLYGNYVTLTHVSKKDLDRISQQRLSPLYVSVHSTDVNLRRKLLGIRSDDHLIDKIRYLTSNRIELHTQIVLCPGLNDGKALQKTIRDLAHFYPQLKSVAIVPVGLTKHRQHLFPIKPVDQKYATRLIERVENWQRDFKRKWDCNFVYLADEFFLLCGQQLPPANYYDGFPQIENGVGLSRSFIDNFISQTKRFPARLPSPKNVTLATGVLASSFMAEIVAKRLNQIENLNVDLVIVKNEFLGESVTVSGLLTGRDIVNALTTRGRVRDLVVLPANCVNPDNLLLDDLKFSELEKLLRTRVAIVSNDFSAIFDPR